MPASKSAAKPKRTKAALVTPKLLAKLRMEAAQQEQAARDEARRVTVIELANDQVCKDGEVEVDDDAKTSEGDDNGCYVQAWVWVDFAGTPLDKEPVKAGAT